MLSGDTLRAASYGTDQGSAARATGQTLDRETHAIHLGINCSTWTIVTASRVRLNHVLTDSWHVAAAL